MARNEKASDRLNSIIKDEAEEASTIAIDNALMPLESIIKVEPEEFQPTTVDDILRSKANIFSDPIVLLERLAVRKTIKRSKFSHSSQRKTRYGKAIDALAREGNEGKRCMDPHTCCICGEEFTMRESLKKHIDIFHVKTERYCDLCSKICLSRDDIRKHIIDNHLQKHFVCDFCGFKTSKKYSFTNHMRLHGEKVKCSVCKKLVSFLQSHMLTHRPPLVCPICQKTVTIAKMKNHIMTHSGVVYKKNGRVRKPGEKPEPNQRGGIHNDREQILKCKSCDETLTSKKNYIIHQLRKHYTGKLHECHCGMVFRQSSRLSEHRRKHNLQLTCEVCDEKFTSVEEVQSHRRSMHFKRSARIRGNNGKYISVKKTSLKTV